MFEIFQTLHPNDTFAKRDNIIENTLEAFKSHFPNYHSDVLRCVAEKFMNVRKRKLNDSLYKKPKNAHLMTVRNYKKIGHFSAPR